LLFVGIIARLYYWQVVKGLELKKQAGGQYRSIRLSQAPRGNILASDGSWLAVMRPGWLLFAEPPKLNTDRKEIAKALSKIFVKDEFENKEDYENAIIKETDRINELLNKKGLVWVPLKNKLIAEEKTRIENLDIKGLGFELQEVRFYPEGSSSAHLLGFLGKNDDGKDVGYFGLEGYYDIILSGKSGIVKAEKDLKGGNLLSSQTLEADSVPGADLKTHIDKRMQLAVEKKLKEALEKYDAKAGSVIVMDPKSGAILAMGSYPSYDPAKYSQFDTSLFRNPVISDSFEPGSVFKVIVMASALDAGVIKKDTICDICDKPLKVDKYSIETWNNKYHPNSTMTEVIINSDNVGMSFVAQKLGVNKMYEYLSKFGIGSLTGIDLQGEATPNLRKESSWNVVDLVTASFGQGIAVTPIQMIKAVSAIANDGNMVTPKIVMDGKSSVIEKVISKEASDEITEMMVEAAKNGEAKWTNLKGFSVAGKTGTAQIPIAGHYDPEKTIASFVGFAPAEDPKFVMLVTLKEPQSSPWASETAAPLWYSIAKDLFQIFGIQPEN
jgi:cell division protein FtsI/penicillin-binding protein 2